MNDMMYLMIISIIVLILYITFVTGLAYYLFKKPSEENNGTSKAKVDTTIDPTRKNGSGNKRDSK